MGLFSIFSRECAEQRLAAFYFLFLLSSLV